MPEAGPQGAGAQAEGQAATFLIEAGLTILARNVRFRDGELDLVCDDRGTTVFVEVRLRRHGGFGGAAESITAAKRARLVAAAQRYLAAQPRRAARPCRFDCVLFEAGRAEPRWIRDAFAAE